MALPSKGTALKKEGFPLKATTALSTTKTGPGTGPGLGAQWGALVAVSLATFMMLVDFASVSVALPSAQQHIAVTFPEVEWTLEAFVLTLAALVLTAGYVADRRGRRSAFLGGLVVLALGSLLAGLAGGPWLLITGRVVQGVGGALVAATGSPLLVDTFRRGVDRLALVVWGTVTGLAVAVSPLVGGILASTLGWRWALLINVPLALLALTFSYDADFSQEAPVRGGARPDWRALFLFSGSIGLFVLGLLRTTTSSSLVGSWSANGVLALFVCAGLLLVALVAVETVSPSPLLNVSLFRSRTFSGAAAAALGLSFAVWGSLLFLVLYLAYDQGFSPIAIGLRLLLVTGMTLPFLPVTGWLERVVPVKVLICGGLGTVAAGLYWASRSTGTGSWHALVPGLVLTGIGLELVNPRLASAAAATVEPALVAVASRTSSTLRWLGTASGVAVLGSVFANRLKDQIALSFMNVPGLQGFAPRVADLVLQGQGATAMASVPVQSQVDVPPIAHLAFASALHEVFRVSAVAALVSAVLSLAVRSADVRRTTLGPNEGSAPQAVALSPHRAMAPAAAVPFWPAPTTVARPQVTSSPITVPVAPPAAPQVTTSSPSQAMAPPAAPARPASPAVANSLAGTPPGRPGRQPLDELLLSFLSDVQSGAPASQPEAEEQASVEDAKKRTALEDVEVARPNISARASSPSDSQDVTEADRPHPGSNGASNNVASTNAASTNGASPSAPATELAPVKPAPPAAPGPIIDLTEGRGRLRGYVTSMNGKPVADGRVTLVGPDGAEVAHIAVADDGSFAFGKVRQGTYTVVAEAPDHRALASVVGLRDSETTTKLSLLGIGSLEGQVSRAATGAPVVAEVDLVGPGGNLVAHCATDHQGRFGLTDLVEGRYQLTVRSPGFRTRSCGVEVLTGADTRSDIELEGTGHLYGAVTSAEGAWVPGTEVVLSRRDGTPVARATADSAGSYQFPDVDEGSYSLSAGGGGAVVVLVTPGAAVQADLVAGLVQA